MAEATLFTSPMARKKPVEARYNPNSYRVISYEAETTVPSRDVTFKPLAHENVIGQNPEPNIEWHHRKNRPNATHVGFLSQDVKLLNEPVCDVYTKATKIEQNSWWPHRVSEEPHKVPGHPLDSICRSDYQYRGKEVSRSSRHAANPHKKPVWGSVPVNFLREKDGKQRFWKEGISYEHQYNCRLDPQYPIRSKRHGSFVWSQFPASEVDRMLHHYGMVADKNQQTSQPESQSSTQPQSPNKPSPSSKSGSASVKENAPPVVSGAGAKTDSLVNTVQGAQTSQQGGCVHLPPII